MSSFAVRFALLRGLPLMLTAGLLVGPMTGPALADSHFPDDPDEAYAEWQAMFADWTVEDAEDAGYTPTDDCVVGPPDQGNMGRHFISISRLTSGKLDPAEPHVILFDENDEVVGIEWELDEVRDPAPMVGGLELEFTPPHEGMDYDHMSRHVYFVGEEEHRFTTFNPAVACPEGAMAEEGDDHGAMEGDDEAAGMVGDDGEDEGEGEADDRDGDDGDRADRDKDGDDRDGYGDDDRDRDRDGDGDRDAAGPVTKGGLSGGQRYDDPSSMPPTGFADWMPGGTLGLLALIAGLMAGLGLIGRRAEARERG